MNLKFLIIIILNFLIWLDFSYTFYLISYNLFINNHNNIFNWSSITNNSIKKIRLNQVIQWRKLHRMTLQLLLSSLFLIFCLPATICFSLLRFGSFNTDALFTVLPYTAYFSYYPQLLSPFAFFIYLNY